MKINVHRRGLLAALLATFAVVGAHAADKRPLRVIVPASAGSGIDTIIRAADPSLTKALDDQPVVVENLPGAGGITGTAALVKSPPDGSTIAVVSNNHVVNPSVYKKMPFDSINDITPISVIGATPFVLVVNPAKIPAKNAKELQAFLKAKPGVYNYASSGNGTIIHLAGTMFVEAAGVDVSHIPYKGMGQMVTDIIGGQVDMGVVSVPVAQGHLKSEALRAILGALGSIRNKLSARRRIEICNLGREFLNDPRPMIVAEAVDLLRANGIRPNVIGVDSFHDPNRAGTPETAPKTLTGQGFQLWQ